METSIASAFSSKSTSLNLSGQGLVNIPEEIVSLENLETLNISDNKIKDLSLVRNLKNLKNLFANDNEISDLSPLEERQLIEVELERNSISDIGPLHNSKESLTSLGITGNKFRDAKHLAGVINDMINLESITLGKNLIRDITFLENKTKLTNINLESNIIDDIQPLVTLIHHLEKPQEMQGIFINDNRFKSEQIDQVLGALISKGVLLQPDDDDILMRLTPGQRTQMESLLEQADDIGMAELDFVNQTPIDEEFSFLKPLPLNNQTVRAIIADGKLVKELESLSPEEQIERAEKYWKDKTEKRDTGKGKAKAEIEEEGKSLQEFWKTEKTKNPKAYEKLKDGAIFDSKFDESVINIELRDGEDLVVMPMEHGAAAQNVLVADLYNDRDGIPLPLTLDTTESSVIIHPSFDAEQIKRAVNPDYNIKVEAAAELQGYKPPTLQWNDRDTYIKEINNLRQSRHDLEAFSDPQRTAPDEGLSPDRDSDILTSPPNSDVEMEGVESSAEQHHPAGSAASNAPSSPKSDVEMGGVESSAGPNRSQRAAAIAASAALLRQHPTSPRNPGGQSRQGRRR